MVLILWRRLRVFLLALALQGCGPLFAPTSGQCIVQVSAAAPAVVQGDADGTAQEVFLGTLPPGTQTVMIQLQNTPGTSCVITSLSSSVAGVTPLVPVGTPIPPAPAELNFPVQITASDTPVIARITLMLNESVPFEFVITDTSP